MNFNSPQFLIFLPSVVAIFVAIHKHERLRDLFLLAASYFFYMCWSWKYAGLIALSTVIDYTIGMGLSRWQGNGVRRFLLITSLTTNLGLLAVFKYFNFFVDVSESAFGAFGAAWSFPRLSFLLPVGISFYTFQTLSYTIDLFRRRIEHEGNFVKFALFVSFFPQLVAGPIVRASEFLPQLRRHPAATREQFNAGLTLIFQGLFKKIVIADLLAALAIDKAFAAPSSFSSLDLYFALFAYAFQIYNDFSGYSDIAIGSAALLGFTLPANFNRPYMAKGIREFWSRWHMSLSTWLRDYLYIPLGGSRKGSFRTGLNLMATMLLGGLWHGAALNFVIWGMYHGFALVVAHMLHGLGFRPLTSAWMRRLMCFHIVLFGWLLFRAENMNVVGEYVMSIARLTMETQFSLLFYFILGIAVLIHVVPSQFPERIRSRAITLPDFVQGLGYATLLLLYLGCTLDTPNFIYFQF